MTTFMRTKLDVKGVIYLMDMKNALTTNECKLTVKRRNETTLNLEQLKHSIFKVSPLCMHTNTMESHKTLLRWIFVIGQTSVERNQTV